MTRQPAPRCVTCNRRFMWLPHSDMAAGGLHIPICTCRATSPNPEAVKARARRAERKALLDLLALVK